ncbi:hypothetical protein D3C75_935990 [compost metagenome]|jgi:hypothetical protein
MAAMIPGRVIIKPAVPTDTCKSLEMSLRTPIGRNSLVTKAKAVIATVNSANQLPWLLGGISEDCGSETSDCIIFMKIYSCCKAKAYGGIF